MFATTKAFSGYAVDDIEAAQRFYGETLGIETSLDNGILTLLLEGGKRPTILYPKPDHRPAEFTVLNFPVDDVDEAVDALTARGVEFLKYDRFPQDERGVMKGNGPDIAWFADPAGNVLSVIKVD
jgi:catechol 2,3-dioxygenase-like lactoylglutathione lyase family enzyme